MACRDFAEDRAGNDVAGCKLRIRMNGGHEATARFIDQDRAFAAQRLGDERRRIACARNGRRMELHEFGVRDDGACAGRQGDALSARLYWICGDRIELADAAAGEHRRRGR